MPVDSIPASPAGQRHLQQLGKNVYAKAKSPYEDFSPDSQVSPSSPYFSQSSHTTISSSASSSPALPQRWKVPRIRLEPPALAQYEEQKSGSVLDTSDDFDSQLSDVLNKLQSVTADNELTSSDPVTLPGRYARRMSDLHEHDVTSSSHDVSQMDDDMTSREKDLGTALKWIRQEILQMKEQDKSLLKQFIELRASILQLRCVYDMHGSCSDVSSLDGSTYSLNEQAKSPKLRRLVLENDFHNKASLSLPNSPRVSRFRWRSDEII